MSFADLAALARAAGLKVAVDVLPVPAVPLTARELRVAAVLGKYSSAEIRRVYGLHRDGVTNLTIVELLPRVALGDVHEIIRHQEAQRIETGAQQIADMMAPKFEPVRGRPCGNAQPLSDAEKALATQLYGEGRKIAEITRRMRRSWTTLRKFLLPNQPVKARRKLTPEYMDRVVELRGQRHTIREIQRRTGLNKSAVLTLLKRGATAAAGGQGPARSGERGARSEAGEQRRKGPIFLGASKNKRTPPSLAQRRSADASGCNPTGARSEEPGQGGQSA